MNYWGLILSFVSCWILQINFSYKQQKDYQKVLNTIKRRQSGFLGVGIAKARFKIGKGAIILLVTDQNRTILEYHELTGFTVFARFKENTDLIGRPSEAAIATITDARRFQAFSQALALINSELQKMED